MFAELPPPPTDEIVPLMLRAARDQRPEKIDMTVGVYRDDNGNTPILKSVREAEQYLAVHRKSKAYSGALGDVDFVAGIRDIAFPEKPAGKHIRGIQTPGGSSAMALILKLIQKARPKTTVWISDPSYANHAPTARAVGLTVRTYPYLNRQDMTLDEPGLLKTLDSLGPSDAVLFHGSCHNPSGLKLSDTLWGEIAGIAGTNRFYPIIDTAYQGLGDSLSQDARGLFILADRVDHLALSFSCSKNFGLYNDRTGCAFLVSRDQNEAETGQLHLAAGARPAHWVPPLNGAEIVKHILSTPALHAQWQKELNAMQQRIRGLRENLARALRRETGTPFFDYIAGNTGMFSMLPATLRQMETLRREYAVYGLDDGRINLAGLAHGRERHAAASIAAVLGHSKGS